MYIKRDKIIKTAYSVKFRTFSGIRTKMAWTWNEKCNIINQIKMDRNMLACTPIIQHEDCLNYCNSCSKLRDQPGERQEMLERILENNKFKYPCIAITNVILFAHCKITLNI